MYELITLFLTVGMPVFVAGRLRGRLKRLNGVKLSTKIPHTQWFLEPQVRRFLWGPRQNPNNK